MLKNSFVVVFFCVFGFSQTWIAKYGEVVFYEKDLFNYIPKKDWFSIDDLKQKEKIVLTFIKQEVAIKSAQKKGLQHSLKVNKKIKNRFHGLIVNEYYMRNFLGSLVPKQALNFCFKNLKKEVFVNHILLPLNEVSIEESKKVQQQLLNGETFHALALNLSIDPSAKQNKGVLGWVSIGQTVPEFQDKIFSLCVGCVDVVETSFGYHVVRVDSVRSSQYKELEPPEYNDWAFKFSTAYIKEDLSLLAAQHDSSLLKENNVFISRRQLEKIIKLIEQERFNFGKEKSRREVDVLGVLTSFPEIVGTYKEEALGGAWFVNKIKNGLYQKKTYYDNTDQLYNDFIRVLIREIVFDLGLTKGVDKGFSFKQQFTSVKKDILQKSWIKHLVDSVPEPSLTEIEDYYNLTKKTNPSLDFSVESIGSILLQQNQKKTQDNFNLQIESLSQLNLVWIHNE